MGRGVRGATLRDILERRAREREEVIRTLERLGRSLAKRMGRVSMILFGSYARGDFNIWSDIDVIVVSEAFEGVEFIRRGLLIEDPLGRISPICWTPDEFRRMVGRPAWRRALEGAVVIRDDHGVSKLMEGEPSREVEGGSGA